MSKSIAHQIASIRADIACANVQRRDLLAQGDFQGQFQAEMTGLYIDDCYDRIAELQETALRLRAGLPA